MKKLSIIGISIALFASCTESDRQNNMATEGDNITTEMPVDDNKDVGYPLSDGEKKGNIELIPIERASEISGAALKVLSPKNGAKLGTGKIDVRYDVEGFDLGSKTTIRTGYNLAESEKGQHIHAILNNEPYMAEYEPYFSTDLAEGQYLLMSFLSRSYHLSVKELNAGQLIQFSVGNPDQEPYDLNQAFLFYSRPKGLYDVGKNPDVLLDFYLENCVLSENGFKIKAKISGFDFTIDSWQPYIIRGLTEGLHTIRLELVDGNGNTVESPFNPVTRNIEVKR